MEGRMHTLGQQVCVCVRECSMVSAWCPSPSSAVLMEPITFSPGPAPVTARTDMEYRVLIVNPVKVKVVTFCSDNIGPMTFLNPESATLVKMTCKGAGVNISSSQAICRTTTCLDTDLVSQQLSSEEDWSGPRDIDAHGSVHFKCQISWSKRGCRGGGGGGRVVT